jgi:hypothetical protein
MEAMGVLMYEIGLIASGFFLGYTASMWAEHFKRKRGGCKHNWVDFGLLKGKYCMKCKRYWNDL